MLGIPKDPQGQKRMLLGMVPLLAAGAYYYFFHTKTQTQVEELQTHFEALQQLNEAAAARTNPAAVRALQQKVTMFEQHAKRLEQLIPLREEVPQLLFDITSRARDAGVEMALFTPAGEEQQQFYVEQTYTLRVIGNYHSIGRFFSHVGSLPRIVTPVDVKVAKPVNLQLDRPSGLRLQADFKIHTYVIPADTTKRPAGTTPTTRANAGD
jgi:Tfp pilus assembly protein PilO